MSNKSRRRGAGVSNKSRRRGAAASTVGIGMAVGGAMAAAFISMGTAGADTTGAVDTVGNFPTDNEITPDPFQDLTNSTTPSATDVGLDQQFNNLNPFYAAQFDYAIDHNQPFTFDGVSATVPAGFNGETGDVDPFEDAAPTSANAAQYDYALNQLPGGPTDAAQLDKVFDGGGMGVTPPIVTPDTEPDPFLDALQATNASASSTQIDQAVLADNELFAANPTYAANLDTAVDTAVANHTLSATSMLGSSTDANGFADAFTNAGVSSTTAATTGGAFDTALSGVATQIDPIVDNLAPVTVVDNDPAIDLLQAFDPHAFTLVGGVETPANFLGTLAVDADSLLNTFGLGAPLDQFDDTLLGAFTGGLGTNVDPLLNAFTGGLGTTTDTLTTMDPLSFLGL